MCRKEVRKDFPKGHQGLRDRCSALSRWRQWRPKVRMSSLSIERVEGYRNFATKVWNAARFAEQNECVRQQDFDPRSVKANGQSMDCGRDGACGGSGDGRY